MKVSCDECYNLILQKPESIHDFQDIQQKVIWNKNIQQQFPSKINYFLFQFPLKINNIPI